MQAYESVFPATLNDRDNVFEFEGKAPEVSFRRSFSVDETEFVRFEA
ncbi:hypothetical protein ACHOLT_09470 [Desulfitobacterium sp. Sab5]